MDQKFFFPKQFTVGFSLRKKRLVAICSGRVSGACPPCVRHLSALCCWLWPRLQSLSATCPPCVHLLLLALAAPPVLVRHLSTRCPPCVRPVFLALAASSILVRLASALCCCFLSALYPPCVLVLGRSASPCWPLVMSAFIVSGSCSPLVCLVSAIMSALRPSTSMSAFLRVYLYIGFVEIFEAPRSDASFFVTAFVVAGLYLFPKQFTVDCSLRKKTGHDMPWPSPRSMSAMSALCPP